MARILPKANIASATPISVISEMEHIAFEVRNLGEVDYFFIAEPKEAGYEDPCLAAVAVLDVDLEIDTDPILVSYCDLERIGSPKRSSVLGPPRWPLRPRSLPSFLLQLHDLFL
jgi:hypothetical protein